MAAVARSTSTIPGSASAAAAPARGGNGGNGGNGGAPSSILLPKNFDVSHVSFAPPKLLGTGGRCIFVNYGEGRLLVQTPEMRVPFGISYWPGENGAPDKYSLDLSFDGHDSRDSVRAFLAMIDSLDRQLIKTGFESSMSWFKRKLPSEEVLEALYTRSLRYSKDKETGEITNKYAPTMKVQLPTRDGKFDFPVFNGAREEIDLMNVFNTGNTKGAKAQAILQLTSVWIVGSKFGITWKVKQLKFVTPAALNGYAFQRTEDDDEEDEAAAAAAPPAGAGGRRLMASGGAGALLPDSDEEGGADPLDG